MRYFDFIFTYFFFFVVSWCCFYIFLMEKRGVERWGVWGGFRVSVGRAGL